MEISVPHELGMCHRFKALNEKIMTDHSFILHIDVLIFKVYLSQSAFSSNKVPPGSSQVALICPFTHMIKYSPDGV